LFKVVGGIFGIIIVFAIVIYGIDLFSDGSQEQFIEDTTIKIEQISNEIALQETVQTITAPVIKEIFPNNTIKNNPPEKTRIVTYSIGKVPKIPDKQISIDALDLAISKWEKPNNIEFVKVENFPDIEIIWDTYSSSTHSGLATCYDNLLGISGNCVLNISLGEDDCSDNYVQGEKEMVANTIMHEIGHALGLDHHLDPDHLMYSDDEFTQTDFDDKGLNIPKSEKEFYVGQEIIWQEYENLASEIELIQSEIDLAKSKYQSLERKYAKYEGQSVSQNEYQKATKIYDELNLAINSYNEMVNNQNNLVKQVNFKLKTLDCYPNFNVNFSSN
jgi:hypothetical protein